MFMLTEEQQMIADTAKSFADEQLAPKAAQWDEERHMDRDVLIALCQLGFGGIYAVGDHGGSALGRLEAAIIFEQLSRGCVSHASFLSIHNMTTWMIDTYGDDELRKRFVPRMVTGELICSYCLTEPGNGSDAANLKTSAALVGDEYVLNGAKVFISGAGFSDAYLVMARTGGEGPGGVSAFVVENGTQGLSFGRQERKMGWNAQPTAMVTFEDCRIPVSNRLGGEGDGFKFAMAGLNGGRLNIAACSLGGAQAAMDRAYAYSKDRQQFGRAIQSFQGIQFKLADMETGLQASRALLYQAAAAFDANQGDVAAQCAMAKRFVTDTCFDVANEALQIHGGYGYLAEYEVERIVRDLRVHQILEGTNEIMRVMIARSLDKV